MTILWTHVTAANATQGIATGSWEATRVEIDSRKVVQGDLFVALKGDNFDGHAYVADALSKGAVAAMVSSLPDGVNTANLLIVKDTQKALEDLGQAGRARSHANVIGVTGSVGKTSTKEMLKLALSQYGETYATAGNYNNHIGTPLNLANLPPSAKFAVLEMGMNHAGEIAHLTRMVKPDIAVITNVEKVHLEFFDSLEDIACAKAEIFEGMSKDSVVVLNANNAYGNYLKHKAEMLDLHPVMCGNNGEAEGQLIGYTAGPSSCEVVAKIGDKEVSYHLGVTGKHWAELSVLVLVVVNSLGLNVELSARKLTLDFKEPEGRGQQLAIVIDGKEILIIDDSYNASPVSVSAAIRKTSDIWQARGGRSRKLAALGDMLELGPESKTLHSNLARDLCEYDFTKIFTTGAWMKHLHDALPSHMQGYHEAHAMDLLGGLRNELRNGDILLIKGSHGSHMYELVNALKAVAATSGEQRHAV